MRIAIVCLNLGWQSGGPRLIFMAARALKRLGHRVTIYAPDFSGEHYRELWDGLDIRVVPPPRALQWSGKPKGFVDWIRNKLAQERVRLETCRRISAALEPDLDAVNVHDYAYPVGLFYKQRNRKTRIIWTENDPPFSYLPKGNIIASALSRIWNAWKELSARKYFRAVDAVSVLDLYNRDWCASRGLTATVIRLGVDFENFYLPVKDIAARTAKKQIRLFGLGSLNRYRHYEDTIRAVKLLRDRGYDALALIIASDQWNESAYRRSLTDLIAQERIGPYIDIRYSGVPEAELKAAYRESDIFVYVVYVPPPRDGFGFSIGAVEAMAAGLPLVLCRTTTCTEVLEDRKTALFVEPLDPASIADQVAWIMDDPARYAAVASAGQEYVKKNLTWERYAQGLVDLIAAKTS